VDTDVELQGLAETPCPPFAQLRTASQHVERRGDGSLGIILVCNRCAEYCQYGIAHELLDKAVVPGDRLGQGLEQLILESAHLFRIEPLGERGVAGDVGE
jgi:hypothetical protein